ncbi:uncharacterized protein H6S33_001343 [Morchella sextelata]|uniref:uncharacterized protein n=1 Tax=Morchella sextelata TaxID=1174677 RepID=UPI001D058807|nr:uncharacterized protein H6S33_001343 [Morchella sextelata]KAH0609115.1 hypothetical protein H6S33_001343 [Morchella sextelata]
MAVAAASSGSYRKADGEEGVTREKVQRSTASKEGGGILQPDRGGEVSVSVKSQRARRRDEQRKLEEEGSCWAVNRVREKEEHQKSKTAKAG